MNKAHNLSKLIENNEKWVKEKLSIRDDYFTHLVDIQSPKYLWIGCSDSRVPANEIVGLEPGEMFVHRNIANVVVQTDMNILSVLEYAVAILKVEHIIIVGHYGCGGVKAAMEQNSYGLLDNWLRQIKLVYSHHENELDNIADENTKFRRMCELNVQEQVLNTCQTSVVQQAWKSKQELTVHGWIYDIADGIIHDLQRSYDSPDQVKDIYRFD
jgi:carbonic anhydrase